MYWVVTRVLAGSRSLPGQKFIIWWLFGVIILLASSIAGYWIASQALSWRLDNYLTGYYVLTYYILRDFFGSELEGLRLGF